VNEYADKGQQQWQRRTFIVDPQGVATEVTEGQLMLQRWKDEHLLRFERDLVGRLTAIAGLLVALISACFEESFGVYTIYLIVFGFAVCLAGRMIVLRAEYEPTKRIQDALEAGSSVIERVSHWF
jgi:hypothetical protein